MKKILVLMLMLMSLAFYPFANVHDDAQTQMLKSEADEHAGIKQDKSTDFFYVTVPYSPVYNQNAVAAANRLYAQANVRGGSTKAERLVYHNKDWEEQEKLQKEILDHAINAHPDPEVVRGIIESALTRGKVKSSFDTLTTYIDPIKGAENLKFRYGWIPPEITVTPDYAPTYDIPSGSGPTSKMSDSILSNATNVAGGKSADGSANKSNAEASKQKEDSIAAAAASKKDLDDKLFKKGKIVDFTWSWIPFRKIKLLIILLPLLWMLRRLRWNNDTKRSTIQSQKDRINAAKIRQAIYVEQEAAIKDDVTLSPVEIVRCNGFLSEYASKLAELAKFNNGISQKLETLAKDASHKERKKVLLALNKKLLRANNEVVHADFESAFKRVHYSFFGKLLSMNSSLTEEELTMCIYLYLGISTNDIALLTGRKASDIESMEKILRKRLHLESKHDFSSFFASI